jgi:hypothetical protein
VLSCEQTEGDGPGPAARYRAVHRPTRLKRAMDIEVELISLHPPRRVELREEDADGVFRVTYRLDPAGGGTLFSQTSEVEWKLPRPLAMLGDRMVPRHVAGQVQALKGVLER